MRWSLSRLLMAIIVVGVPSQSSASDKACPDSECLAGERITILVGYSAGGGYDAYARMLAPQFEARTGATVVVRNRPGGGGLIAINELAADNSRGMTLGLINVTAAVVAQGLNDEAARFDLADLVWVGGIQPEPRALIARAGAGALPWEHPDQSGAVRWAAGGRIDGLAIDAALVSEALGLDARIVTGYSGSHEAVLGVLRGEADAVSVSADSAGQYAELRDVEIVALLTNPEGMPFLGVPALRDLIGDANVDTQWLDLLEILSSLGRGLAASGGASPEQVAILRVVFTDILNDDRFQADIGAAGRRMTLASHEALGQDVRSILRVLHDDPDVRHVVGDKYR